MVHPTRIPVRMPRSSRASMRTGPSRAASGTTYVQGLAGAGLVFVSGQLPIRPDGTGLQDKGFDAQVRQALANVLAMRAGRRLRTRADSQGDRFHRRCGSTRPMFNKIYADACGEAIVQPGRWCRCPD